MTLKCGIVGLPNVGKSTLFNALTNTAQAQAANYPFCTIEPNIATVAVPDERLQKLSKIANSIRVVPNIIEIVDIAGLVRGASKGEGLGNKFLENIRNVDAIIQVLRCFENPDIIHTENSVNPIRDVEIIELELLISDINYLEKTSANMQKTATQKKEIAEQKDLVDRMLTFAKEGNMLISFPFTESEYKIASKFHLLTMKKTIYVANVSEKEEENIHFEKFKDFANKKGIETVPICIKMEAEMIEFSEEDKIALLQDAGFENTALGKLIQASYKILDLLTFFTVGEKETRAWSVRNGSFAPNAAGVIHTDFEKGFIKAETVAYEDFIVLQGLSSAKDAGKLRMEGKEYLVKEGDIFNFKFNI